MATVTLGNIKFNWKGPYNNSTAYVVDDVVSSGGSSYVCILASTGNAVSNGTYWQQMSAAGTNGTDLTTTLTTQGDIVYRDGSGLQRLAAGTAGQFLKTGGTGANPSWGSVTSKLLGQKMSVYQTRQVIGSANQSATEITGLAVSYGAPVKNTSYFVVKASITQWTSGNHTRGALQYSVDGGSNWSSDWTNTRSGSNLNWGSSQTLYNYPHISIIYNISDTNTTSQGSCILKYAPSTPHSISDFRVRYLLWNQDASNNIIVNGVANQSNSHSNVLPSTVEVIEYET